MFGKVKPHNRVSKDSVKPCQACFRIAGSAWRFASASPLMSPYGRSLAPCQIPAISRAYQQGLLVCSPSLPCSVMICSVYVPYHQLIAILARLVACRRSPFVPGGGAGGGGGPRACVKGYPGHLSRKLKNSAFSNFKPRTDVFRVLPYPTTRTTPLGAVRCLYARLNGY